MPHALLALLPHPDARHRLRAAIRHVPTMPMERIRFVNSPTQLLRLLHGAAAPVVVVDVSAVHDCLRTFVQRLRGSAPRTRCIVWGDFRAWTPAEVFLLAQAGVAAVLDADDHSDPRTIAAALGHAWADDLTERVRTALDSVVPPELRPLFSALLAVRRHSGPNVVMLGTALAAMWAALVL
jgi:DNA-binding NarL/FixJ family response regulator